MMVHIDESFNFQTSGNSYVNFDLISLLGLTLPTETNDIPENLKKKIIRVKASRPLVFILKCVSKKLLIRIKQLTNKLINRQFNCWVFWNITCNFNPLYI